MDNKTKKSGFGISKGIASFTKEDKIQLEKISKKKHLSEKEIEEFAVKLGKKVTSRK